jgi:hypothetical protein
MNQNSEKQPLTSQKTVQPSRPNDTGSISVEGFVKVFDPSTKEVYVEKRA